MTQTEGHTKTNMVQIQMKTKGYLILMPFVDFYQRLTSRLFVLFMQAFFFQIEVQPSLFCEGKANMRGVTLNSFRKINQHLY